MLKIGLTGGLGCGKSTVGELFSARGVPVFDADRTTRELMQPGRPALRAVVAEFGEQILTNGALDRVKLRQIVFADSKARGTLEAIIHPLVYAELSEKAKLVKDPYCIFAIPLLIETGKQSFVDRILVVDCSPEQQYERVRERDKLDDASIELILQAQAGRDQRLEWADDIIENVDGIGRLDEQVEKLHQTYLTLARRH